MSSVIERIEETTVGLLGGARVAVGTMVLSGNYFLPDGTPRRGVTGLLVFPDESSTWVGAGSEVEFEGQRWRVVAATKAPGEPGELTLERQGNTVERENDPS